jgi:hypothetical protein
MALSTKFSDGFDILQISVEVAQYIIERIKRLHPVSLSLADRHVCLHHIFIKLDNFGIVKHGRFLKGLLKRIVPQDLPEKFDILVDQNPTWFVALERPHHLIMGNGRCANDTAAVMWTYDANENVTFIHSVKAILTIVASRVCANRSQARIKHMVSIASQGATNLINFGCEAMNRRRDH